MSEVKPTVVLVPGAWHTSECFGDVVRELNARGYPAEAVDHPSIGHDRTKSTVDDVANVQKVMTKLVDEGKEIVLVCHSYGGIVASNAAEGFGALERAQDGKKGGIISLIYMTAFVLRKGEVAFGALGGKPLPWMDVQGDATCAKNGETIFYNDIPADKQAYWISTTLPISTSVFTSPVTYEPWLHMPVSFQVCTLDNAIPVGLQRGMVEFLKGTSPYPVTVVEMEASHSPFLSFPEKSVEGIEVAAKAGAEQKIKL